MTDNTAYLKRILTMPVHPGQVTVVEVRHDPGCPLLAGGACTCAPDVVRLNRPERRAHHRRGRR